MKFPNGQDALKLRSKLIATLEQENKSFAAGIQSHKSVEERNHRDNVVRWLLWAHCRLGYSPDTFDLSVTILDRFLLLVRAQQKYLKCIAISSYFLAAKCVEEDEIILATCDLVAVSKCGCSVAEVLRMERLILSKLKWDPLSKTVLDFVHVLYALLINEGHLMNQHEIDYHLKNLIDKLYICLCEIKVRSFRPSTLAVALICTQLSLYTRNYNEITVFLKNEILLETAELTHCRRVISGILSRKNSIRISRERPLGWKEETKPCKRKVEQTEVDDDVYDGIKRLYGDETVHDSNLSCTSKQRCYL